MFAKESCIEVYKEEKIMVKECIYQNKKDESGCKSEYEVVLGGRE